MIYCHHIMQLHQLKIDLVYIVKMRMLFVLLLTIEKHVGVVLDMIKWAMYAVCNLLFIEYNSSNKFHFVLIERITSKLIFPNFNDSRLHSYTSSICGNDNTTGNSTEGGLCTCPSTYEYSIGSGRCRKSFLI
jgi:hypothetical protein